MKNSPARTSGHRILIPVALAILPFLYGCALEPVDIKPETKIPENWSAPKSGADEVVSDTWWKSFGDQKLDTVVDLALKNSPDLESSFARVRAARAAAGLADSGFWPTINGKASWTRQRLSESQIIPATGGQTYNTEALGGSIDYEFDIWGKIRNKSRAAEADYRSSHADLAAARLLVAAEVVRGWFDLSQAIADRKTLEETYATRQQSYELQAAREKAGIIGGDDVSRARLDAANAKYELENTVLRIGLLRNALSASVGEIPGTVKLPEPDENSASKIPSVPVSLPSSVIRHRPDLASADLKLDAALKREGAARADFYPNLTLSATGGFSSITAGDLLNSGSRVWALTPQLSLPIFTGGRNDANLETARAQFDANWAAYRKSVLTAFRETEDALLTVDRLGEQEKLITDVVNAANETLTFAKARYEKGLSSNLEVTVAERDALTAKRSYTQVRHDRLRAAANLARVLGGGWNRDTGVDKSVAQFEERLEQREEELKKQKETRSAAEDAAKNAPAVAEAK